MCFFTAYIEGISGAPSSLVHCRTMTFCACENLRCGELKRRCVKNSYMCPSEAEKCKTICIHTGIVFQGYSGSLGEKFTIVFNLVQWGSCWQWLPNILIRNIVELGNTWKYLQNQCQSLQRSTPVALSSCLMAQDHSPYFSGSYTLYPNGPTCPIQSRHFQTTWYD